MKKTIVTLSLLVAGLVFGLNQAQAAVPTVDGLISGGLDFNTNEWKDDSYTYYLNVTDPDEAGVDQDYDIERVVLLQNLDAGKGSKGVYMLIKTYATPTLLDNDAFSPGAQVSLFADFNGDGIVSNAGGGYPADIVLVITNNGITDSAAGDRIFACFGASGTCDPFNPTFVLLWNAGVGNTGAIPAFAYGRGADGFEFFFPTGTFGTPADVAFPLSFIGHAEYVDGSIDPDDIAFGSVNIIPEPSSVVLMGLGLLSLIGLRRKK